MSAISVIIPTHNRARLVEEAIKSVLNQTYADFELIVVDDESTDNTEEVVGSFNDPRMKYLKRLHEGPSATRNAGIRAAIGEFIAFLDDDDLFLPEKLSLQMARVVENPTAGLVYGRYLSNTGSEGLMKTAGVCYPHLELSDLLLGPAFHWSTVLIRRSLLDQAGGFDELSSGEDWELTLRLALMGCQMICVPEPVSIVRRQPIGNTRDMRYMSALLAVIDKTFSDPRMPLDLIELRDLAKASQLLRIAASAYVTSQLQTGRDFLQHAIETCPTLAKEQLDFLVDTLVYRIRGLSLEDPEEVLKRVTQYLPGDDLFLKNLRRRLWGKFYEIAAFESYQLGQRARCIAYVIRAVTKTPSCLRNRGLFSILMRSLVGNGIFDIFKGLSSTLRRSEA